MNEHESWCVTRRYPVMSKCDCDAAPAAPAVAQPAAQERLTYWTAGCTDPDNCQLCKAQRITKRDHYPLHHAGIPTVEEPAAQDQINGQVGASKEPTAKSGDVKNDPEASGLNPAGESRNRSRRETATADLSTTSPDLTDLLRRLDSMDLSLREDESFTAAEAAAAIRALVAENARLYVFLELMCRRAERAEAERDAAIKALRDKEKK